MSKYALWLLLALPAEGFRTRRKRLGMNGEWVAMSPIQDVAMSNSQSQLEFHGAFRDLSLWKDRKVAQSASHSQTDGSDQLWVIEYNNTEELKSESLRASSSNLKVLFHEGDSLVIQGNVPATLGYDACGGEKGKTVISVADYEVTVRAMPSAETNRYLALAQTKDPRNEAIQKLVLREELRATITKLVDFRTRHSSSGEQGMDPAAEWAVTKLEGYGFTVTRDDFRPGNFFQRRMTPQIIAELRGTESPDRVVVLGAHIDATAGWGFDASVAPGGDDNGSGSAALLEFARVISASGVRFKHTLRLCLFTGEEQGLLGSRAIARKWKGEGVDIIAMINIDMIGYRQPGQPITLALMSRNGDAGLASIVVQTAQTYLSDKLQIGYTSGCCSDQQAFYENGYTATGIFETPTNAVVYPEYHKVTDLLDKIDFEQVEYHATAAMASVILLSEISS